MQKLPDAGVRLVQIGCEIYNDLCTGRVMVGGIRRSVVMLIAVMLIGNHAGQVVMAAVNIDVLMFAASHMSVRMAQWRQHQADTHNETEHSQQRRHRAEV